MHRAFLLALGASYGLALPLNSPTRIFSTNCGSIAYIFAPLTSFQFSLTILDTSNTVSALSPPLSTLFSTLPFLSSSKPKAFIPLVDERGNIEVLAGDCTNTAQGLELWRFRVGSGHETGTWSQLQITLGNASPRADYLSAGFSFSRTNSTSDASVYIFGGMCPNQGNTNSSNWIYRALYSNTMLTITTATGSQIPLDASITGSQAPLIAEAGHSITPLMPAYFDTSGHISNRQSFLLLGGHTGQAFINMSVVALFTLPEESWTFLAIDPPGLKTNPKVAVQTSERIEPRSGHTAVLTEGGTKIIVFGGWVGDIYTPAMPQLIILEVGQGYGGSGGWAWTIPTDGAAGLSGTSGFYGHGATMLPGGVMMITGGNSISSDSTERATQTTSDKNLDTYMFFNTTSSSWISSYINPASLLSPKFTNSTDTSSRSLHSSAQKAGPGIGLSLGMAALIGVVVVPYWYSRRRRPKQSVHGKHLRELALSETSSSDGPQREVLQRATSASVSFWRSRQGKIDWEEGALPESNSNVGPSGTVQGKALPGQEKEDDWDPEEAVKNRAVQFMFTVPKGELRVVNA